MNSEAASGALKNEKHVRDLLEWLRFQYLSYSSGETVNRRRCVQLRPGMIYKHLESTRLYEPI